MASASKRLNERLAKYTHKYDDEEQHNGLSATSDEGDNTAAIVNNGTGETELVVEEPAVNNSNENNNVIEPERVPVKKIMENVSVVRMGNGSVNSAASLTTADSCMSNSGAAAAGSSGAAGVSIVQGSSTNARTTNNVSLCGFLLNKESPLFSFSRLCYFSEVVFAHVSKDLPVF